MTQSPETRTFGRARALALAAGWSAGVTGAFVLLGWLLDIGFLKSVLPGAATMKPNSALCFVLAGWALVMRCSGQQSRAAHVGAATVLIVAALTLTEIVLGRDYGLDQWLFPNAHPGRMAVGTAFAFLMLGFSLLCLDVNWRGWWPGESGALLVFLTAIVPFFGYGYGFYDLERLGGFSTMAPHTSVLFALLGLGVLHARPARALMAAFTSENAGGVMARRVLPLAIALSFLANWAQARGGRSAGFTPELGLLLFAALNVGGLSARSLNHADAARRMEERKLEDAADVAGLGSWEWDLETESVSWSRQIYKLLGRDPSLGPLTPEEFVQFVHPEDRAKTVETQARIRSRYDSGVLDFRTDPAQGPERHFTVRYRVNQGSPGRGPRATGVMLDVTLQKRAQEEIKTLNAELEQRVTERTAALEDANQQLEAFSSSVSHDLRAPLRHIRGFAEILEENTGATLDEKSHDLLKKIFRAVTRMQALINDLLEFSRVQRAVLSRQRFEMGPLLKDVIEELAPDSQGRTVEWRIATLPAVEADARLVRQVWANLVSNALKFTKGRDPATIEVGTCAENGVLPTFFVRDNGAGFDMQYVEKLFGVFQRLHKESDFEGTGIGLANVQKIVQRHGGRIWADATPEQGATFFFTLGAGGSAGRKEPRQG